jgi:hypothetical protein
LEFKNKSFNIVLTKQVTMKNKQLFIALTLFCGGQLFTLKMGAAVYAQVSPSPNVVPAIGNVGIGTLAPKQKLHVMGSVLVDSSLVIRGPVVFPNINDLSNNTDSIQHFLIIDSTGKISRKKINIAGLSSFDSEFQEISICDLDFGEGTPHPASLKPKWASRTGKLYVPCHINIGINTANPRAFLEVAGNAIIRNLLLGNIQGSTNQGAALYIKAIDYSSIDNSIKKSVMLIENSERRLFQVGNDGLVRAREVKVDLNNNWPDYVFEKNYALPTLTQTKQFIAQNGHLPGVPSAKEVQENGIALGEMNRILLEKVEELTLYLIQMEKRMKELESKIGE